MGSRKNEHRGFRSDRAYSLLELQIAIIVLTLGFLGITATIRVHSRQLRVLSNWDGQPQTYYVAGQTNGWMRALGAPAEMHTDPYVGVWAPPVYSYDRDWYVSLDSFNLDYDQRSGTADVTLNHFH